MKETGIEPELPHSLKNILEKKERYEKLPKNTKAFIILTGAW